MAIHSTRTDTIEIVPDISHMHHTIDLRSGGAKTVLVKSSKAVVTPAEEQLYSSVEAMHPAVEQYRMLYANDLEERLGLAGRFLPKALGFSTLLNPLFGLKTKTVGSGLMSDTQYAKARSSKR